MLCVFCCAVLKLYVVFVVCNVVLFCCCVNIDCVVVVCFGECEGAKGVFVVYVWCMLCSGACCWCVLFGVCCCVQPHL